jgi:hypothetical protein
LYRRFETSITELHIGCNGIQTPGFHNCLGLTSVAF